MACKIFISGGACSGKSTLARALAEKIGCPTTSFGDILRRHSERENLSLERPALQALGSRLIGELGYNGFLDWIVSHSTELPWNGMLVLEGVRHAKMCEALKMAYPRSILIHCDVGAELQVTRMMKRDGATIENVKRILGHELEQSIMPMRALADLVSDEFTPFETTVEKMGPLLRRDGS